MGELANEIARIFEKIRNCRIEIEDRIGLLAQQTSRNGLSSVNREITEKLAVMDNDCENLRIEIENIDSSSSRQDVAKEVGKLEIDCTGLRRKQIMSYNCALNNLNRTELLERERVDDDPSGSLSNARKRRIRSAKNSIGLRKGTSTAVSEATELTDSLQRVLRQMEQEVERSVEINKTLASSTNFLSKAMEQHEKLGSVMNMSKKYILEHLRRDLKDRASIFASFLLLILTVAHVLKKHLYGGNIVLLKFDTVKKLIHNMRGEKKVESRPESMETTS